MASLLITLLQSAGVAFLGKLIGATVTEKVLSKLFFQLAERLAASSTNGLDDDMVRQIKAAYFREGESNDNQSRRSEVIGHYFQWQ